MKSKEEYTLTYGEIYNYIKSKGADLDEYDVTINLDIGVCLYELNEEHEICALVIYTLLSDKSGHHIYFFGADSHEYRKRLIIQGLLNKCWPKQSVRRKKLKYYSKPEKLIKRFLTN